MIEKAELLVKLTCEHYKLTSLKRGKERPFKIVKNKDNVVVRVAEIRMALSYFLYKYCPLNMAHIAALVGYSDHTSLSLQYKKIDYFIQTEDEKIYPYYLVVKQIAENIGINMDAERLILNRNKLFKMANQIYVVK